MWSLGLIGRDSSCASGIISNPQPSENTGQAGGDGGSSDRINRFCS